VEKRTRKLASKRTEAKQSVNSEEHSSCKGIENGTAAGRTIVGRRRRALTLDGRQHKNRADLRVHGHLLAQTHAEGGVDLQRLLLDGDVLLERRARLEQAAESVFQLTKLLLELTNRLVDLVHLRLQTTRTPSRTGETLGTLLLKLGWNERDTSGGGVLFCSLLLACFSLAHVCRFTL